MDKNHNEMVNRNKSNSKKCVIITTINPTTEAIKKHIQNKEYDVIISGDKKTPDCYYDEDCIYLDLESQKRLFPELYELIPFNHYGRKNFGYLYAIQNGYDLIYETDDDNIPHDNFDDVLAFGENAYMIHENNSEWINTFKYFTNNNHIWPRGYPLSLIKENIRPDFHLEKTNTKPALIAGLVENDPDVDALFRLICTHEIYWEKDKKIIVSNKNICIFNTQNTFWVHPRTFIALLLPCSVSFRYCDILKGIIANIILRKNGQHMAYTSPNVTQIRNQHNLINDFKSEIPMYLANERILDFLTNHTDECPNAKELLRKIYHNLLENDVITELDIKICNEWLSYF